MILSYADTFWRVGCRPVDAVVGQAVGGSLREVKYGCRIQAVRQYSTIKAIHNRELSLPVDWTRQKNG